MIIFLFMILGCSLYGMRCRTVLCLDSALERRQTAAIKGVFILLVLLRHAYPYVFQLGGRFTSRFDQAFLLFDGRIAQLIVVMFLFYSGYGVMESIRRRGGEYVRQIPIHRVVATLLNFDVAVVLFFGLDFLLGLPLDGRQTLKAFLAWDSIGNSNWYILVIILCYGLTWVAYYLAYREETKTALVLCVLLAVAAFCLSHIKPLRYYNTIMAYGAGALCSAFRIQVGHFLSKWYKAMVAAVILAFVAFYACPFADGGVVFNFKSLVFATMVILFTMKVEIGNPALCWLGDHLFPLYIYQRVPMLLFVTLTPAFVKGHHMLFILICFAVTLGIAWLYPCFAIDFHARGRRDR